MRLHSVRLRELPQTTDRIEMRDARADFIRDLMVLHGCYLQRVFDLAAPEGPRAYWVARYE